MQPDHLGEVVTYREARIERGHRLLEDHADGAAAQRLELALIAEIDGLAIQAHAAGRHARSCRQQAKHGKHGQRLAAAAFTDDPERFGIGKIEIDVVDQDARIFTLPAHNGQIAQREDRVGRRIRNRLGRARLQRVPMRGRGPGFNRRVAEAVAEQPETENRQRQHATGRKQQPGKVVDRCGGLEHHAAPTRRRWWNAEAEEVNAGLDRQP